MATSFLFFLPYNLKRSRVHAEQVVDCPFSLALDEADKIFPLLKTSEGGVRMPFKAFRLPLKGAFTHPVSIQFRRQNDMMEQGRLHDEIDFDWQAKSPWLPDFHGVLHFRIEHLKTRILLDGEYLAPLGFLGSYIDSFIGKHIADLTAKDFVARISQALEKSWGEIQSLTASRSD